ncbi:MAG: hypothetical protein ACJ739_05155, partial [Acidimicrobiales bacterium]
MTRWAAALGGAALLVAACTTTSSGPPAPGPGGGPVGVRPNVSPRPGATIVLSLTADDAYRGSACTTLDEWVQGGWRSRWYWERSSPEARPIPDGEERTCPAAGVPLPAQQTISVPADLGEGTWRLGDLAGDDVLGAPVVEVGGAPGG